MDSRQLAALLSSLISQLTLLILLLYPSSPISSNSDSHPHSPDFHTLFSLLHHFLSSSDVAATICRKRRRTHVSDHDSDPESLSGHSKLGRLARVNSALVKDPGSFRAFFKMTPSTFEWLSGLLEPLLECRDPVGPPLNLSAELRLGIGLYRLSTGSDYSEIAHRFGVTDRVAKFCSKQLCRVLCTNFRFWVGFPNSLELDSVSQKFENITGLPNCCGVISCTRFKVKEESIAAQIVVDSSCRILSIVVGFHGDKSNTRVLRSTSLFKDIQGGKLLNSNPNQIGGVNNPIPQYLVGTNNEYPLLPWLMIPYNDPIPGSNEERFNAALEVPRISMFKTVASLKNWGILSKPIQEEFRNAVAYVGACAILHNALLLREDYSGLCDQIEDYELIDHGLIHRDCSIMEDINIHGCVVRSALATKVNNFQ
ncbi:hypothetical protein SOVF_009640 [Spinacia oleracea]|uniref:Protein ANTAGONIST OF LIKE HETEROCHROMATIN PROTEIN 1-like n=1 Tax=Spinacia oleracea TaxID=3562 RepID=A0A9R0JXA0_SPIOL|nr:protein ANTAGONIST OF LIKE HETEROCHROMATIN PROTEIN 1-like [Spinacia oleracea]KNA25097.1 hypothetical protein SOVF_009640 [Spinacia oleracea]